MVNAGTLDAWLARDPRGAQAGRRPRRSRSTARKPDADPLASSKKGYLPEKWVIEHVEAAGFKLAGKSEINANPKDTKDYSEGVWALPPSLQLGDKDHDKVRRHRRERPDDAQVREGARQGERRERGEEVAATITAPRAAFRTRGHRAGVSRRRRGRRRDA